MKAISLKQPWAWLVSSGLEYSHIFSWNTEYRGPIYIHASSTMDSQGYKLIKNHIKNSLPHFHEFHFGGIVGQATLSSITKTAPPWFSGPYEFKFSNSKDISFHPATGKQGLFEIPNKALRVQEMYWQIIVNGKVLSTMPDSQFRKEYKRLKQLRGIDFQPISHQALQGITI